MKVLLVDDSIVFRKAQTKVLRSIGVEDIYEAENGKVALKILEEHGYDMTFVLLDINMPVLSGLETLQVIRHRSKDLPVIMCTSEAGKEKIMAALKAGASTYLLKPVNKEDMLSKVQQYAKAESAEE